MSVCILMVVPNSIDHGSCLALPEFTQEDEPAQDCGQKEWQGCRTHRGNRAQARGVYPEE